jgi:ABC-type branched-subunit amino acid transport system substrate-binding protein
VVIPVVASLSGPTSLEDRTFVDGMRLAVREVNHSGGPTLRLDVRDDHGSDATTVDLARAALGASVATFVVGSGATVSAIRPDVERDGDPVFLLGGDLYSSRGLFRQVFQTSIPYAWQSPVMAHYLVLDRDLDSAAVEAAGGDAATARDAFSAAMAEEHGQAVSDPTRADAEAVFGAAADPEASRVVMSTDGLVSPAALEPGTAATYAYTWAGWADPIPRVHRFRVAIERLTGHPPLGFEQEGYDAIRVLAEALDRTDGEGGPAMVHALETTRDVTFSSVALALSPDDHVLAPRGQLGLFAIPGPGDPEEPWIPADVTHWTPIMRTFTYNGERTSIPKEDWDVFYPEWPRWAGPPDYDRSRYGITTDTQDPLH